MLGEMRFEPPDGRGRARPAGPPASEEEQEEDCLAGRRGALLARLASWLEEECPPPAPITAGGLCGSSYRIPI